MLYLGCLSINDQPDFILGTLKSVRVNAQVSSLSFLHSLLALRVKSVRNKTMDKIKT